MFRPHRCISSVAPSSLSSPAAGREPCSLSGETHQLPASLPHLLRPNLPTSRLASPPRHPFRPPPQTASSLRETGRQDYLAVYNSHQLGRPRAPADIGIPTAHKSKAINSVRTVEGALNMSGTASPVNKSSLPTGGRGVSRHYLFAVFRRPAPRAGSEQHICSPARCFAPPPGGEAIAASPRREVQAASRRPCR